LPIPVSASTLTTWQNMVSNSTTTLYWYSVNDVFMNLSYDFDLNNFPFWSTTTPDFYLKQPTTPPNWDYAITIPTNSENYNFWIIAEGGSYQVFNYKSGGNSYQNACSEIKNIVLADKTLKLIKCGGVNYNPITNVVFSVGSFATEIYLAIYTDDNLDQLITDETTMYNYLNNLSNYNALFGGWASTTPLTLPAGTCENLDVFSGALCKVITFLFVPSSTALTQFSNLKDLIATKPPFGYWTSIKNYLNNLNSTSTPAFTLTAEIGNIGIFDTLKTGLAWVLWLFFGFWVIKRIARFDF
jgi:hypothetical protein